MFSVNCQWSSWDTWTTCSKTCGIGFGTRERSRTVQTPAKNDGLPCEGSRDVIEKCTIKPCPGKYIIIAGFLK